MVVAYHMPRISFVAFSCSSYGKSKRVFVFQAYLWGGLLLFCGFIMWDTQMIIEKKRRGDGDYIAHSVDLFIDFIQVFRKVIIILTQKVTSWLYSLQVSIFSSWSLI